MRLTHSTLTTISFDVFTRPSQQFHPTVIFHLSDKIHGVQPRNSLHGVFYGHMGNILRATTVSAAAEAAAALRHRRGNFLPTPKSMVVAAINSPWRSTCDRSNEQVGRERLLLAMLPYGTHTWFVIVDSEHTFRGRKHSKLLRGCCYAISRLLRTAPSTGLDGSSTPIDKICHARSCCCSSP